MNNYIQPGAVLTLTAPVGGVVSGRLYLIAGLAVIATNDAAAAAEFEGMFLGVVSLAKASGAWTEGQSVYWDAANNRCALDPTVGAYVGAAADAAASGDATGKVRLNGISGAGPGALNVRRRFTVAEVNAGATLLAAMAGRKIRMIDAIMIAVGGAATAVTTVDILATLSSSRKLVAAAQAGLTQSTVVRAGDATGAVLADGASFTANDANTAVTVGKTGANVATATHIDVIFSFALDT
jgi:predicted RecA/RadA family phage recombinase